MYEDNIIAACKRGDKKAIREQLNAHLSFTHEDVIEWLKTACEIQRSSVVVFILKELNEQFTPTVDEFMVLVEVIIATNVNDFITPLINFLIKSFKGELALNASDVMKCIKMTLEYDISLDLFKEFKLTFDMKDIVDCLKQCCQINNVDVVKYLVNQFKDTMNLNKKDLFECLKASHKYMIQSNRRFLEEEFKDCYAFDAEDITKHIKEEFVVVKFIVNRFIKDHVLSATDLFNWIKTIFKRKYDFKIIDMLIKHFIIQYNAEMWFIMESKKYLETFDNATIRKFLDVDMENKYKFKREDIIELYQLSCVHKHSLHSLMKAIMQYHNLDKDDYVKCIAHGCGEYSDSIMDLLYAPDYTLDSKDLTKWIKEACKANNGNIVKLILTRYKNIINRNDINECMLEACKLNAPVVMMLLLGEFENKNIFKRKNIIEWLKVSCALNSNVVHTIIKTFNGQLLLEESEFIECMKIACLHMKIDVIQVLIVNFRDYIEINLKDIFEPSDRFVEGLNTETSNNIMTLLIKGSSHEIVDELCISEFNNSIIDRIALPKNCHMLRDKTMVIKDSEKILTQIELNNSIFCDPMF